MNLVNTILGCLLLCAACSTDQAPQHLPKLPPNATVLAFGDSLTFGTGVKAEMSYPAVLSRLIARRVIRSGVPGEVSGEGLKRLKGELQRHNPDLVILLHGGNDILRRQNANQSYNNLRSMIQMVQENGSSLVLIGVPGFSLNLSGASAAPQYEQLAKELKLLYDGQTLPELLYKKKYKSDSVHLNQEGYQLLAEAIVKLLKQAGAL